MAPPLPSEQMLARQTMLQVWQDVQAGSRPSTWCPISLPHALCLPPSPSVLSKSNHLLFSLLFYYPSLHLTCFHHPILTTSQRLAATFAGQLKGRQHPRRKMTYFFTLRNLSWWLLRSATESFWQKLLRIGKRAYGDEELATENSCTVKVIQFDQGYMYCFGIVTVAAVKVQIYKSFLYNKRKMSSSPNISLRTKYLPSLHPSHYGGINREAN